MELGSAIASVLGGLSGAMADLEALYKDVHSHPELAMQERRTAALAARGLEASGFAVTEGVGGTGVVGVLDNGPGPAVMLRACRRSSPGRSPRPIRS